MSGLHGGEHTTRALPAAKDAHEGASHSLERIPQDRILAFIAAARALEGGLRSEDESERTKRATAEVLPDSAAETFNTLLQVLEEIKADLGDQQQMVMSMYQAYWIADLLKQHGFITIAESYFAAGSTIEAQLRYFLNQQRLTVSVHLGPEFTTAIEAFNPPVELQGLLAAIRRTANAQIIGFTFKQGQDVNVLLQALGTQQGLVTGKITWGWLRDKMTGQGERYIFVITNTDAISQEAKVPPKHASIHKLRQRIAKVFGIQLKPVDLHSLEEIAAYLGINPESVFIFPNIIRPPGPDPENSMDQLEQRARTELNKQTQGLSET